MTDDDHVRAIRNAVLAINEVEKKLEPLYTELNRLREHAERDGLQVLFTPGLKLGTKQPRITREVEL